MSEWERVTMQRRERKEDGEEESRGEREERWTIDEEEKTEGGGDEEFNHGLVQSCKIRSSPFVAENAKKMCHPPRSFRSHRRGGLGPVWQRN